MVHTPPEELVIRLARTGFLTVVAWTCASLWAAWALAFRVSTFDPGWNYYTRFYAYSLVQRAYVSVLCVVLVLLASMLTAPEVRRRRAIWVSLVVGGVTLACHAFEKVR